MTRSPELPKNLRGLKVAIVHDWLVGGGAERVVAELHKLFPEAPIYTSYCTPEWRKRLDNKVVTGWLQRFGRIRKFMGLGRIWWFTHLDFSGYDLVISSSGAEAKGIRVSKGTLHVNYCHAPTHYYWSRYDEYMAHPGFGVLDPLARFGLRLLVAPLRRWDYKAAQRPDFMLANSTHIQAEIKKYYGRDATVVFPPVDTSRFSGSDTTTKRHGFVIVGRQTPYKRVDLAVAACTKLGLPLTVVGTGPDHQRLRAMAGPSITFVINATDADVVRYFQSAFAFIFPLIDDFGVVSLESLAAGTPIIALRGGGALDYVVPGQTGEFFDEQTVDSLCLALQKFKPGNYDHTAIHEAAQAFSPKHFDQQILTFLAQRYTA